MKETCLEKKTKRKPNFFFLLVKKWHSKEFHCNRNVVIKGVDYITTTVSTTISFLLTVWLKVVGCDIDVFLNRKKKYCYF